MRILSVLALVSPVVLFLSPLAIASDGVAESRPFIAAKAPAPHVPDGVPWLVLPMLGYISMELKRQVRRRGFLSGDRQQTFSDLISLERPRGVSDPARSPANAAFPPPQPDADPQ